MNFNWLNTGSAYAIQHKCPLGPYMLVVQEIGWGKSVVNPTEGTFVMKLSVLLWDGEAYVDREVPKFLATRVLGLDIRELERELEEWYEMNIVADEILLEDKNAEDSEAL